ncbi:MAG: AmmeMemoRadiSam system radical SAM enzyme [Candidatus Eisenbacteria bacterium]|nr:AmmeMemoRadiSam system radical SAM enzyme [Candidatus Eisenbacteria bacterium]
MVEAKHWTVLDAGKVRCDLCPHHCTLSGGQAGICMGRVNENGKLYSSNFGQVVSASLDPIEKKPLYHFFPGSLIFSVGPNGCNFRCPYCQNWEISQRETHTSFVPPHELVRNAGRDGSVGIAYTYAEPLIWYEYVLECSKLAREAGLVNVLVTNGFIEKAPLAELLPLIDALNIDVKSVREEFYKKLCKASLEPVLRTCETAKKVCHVEITNLLIPGENTGKEDVTELVRWIASKLGKDTPLHFSRYFPHYKFAAEATTESTLFTAYEIGKKELFYCYVGNVRSANGANTYCPKCGNMLVERAGYSIRIAGIEDRKCSRCGRNADFVL